MRENELIAKLTEDLEEKDTLISKLNAENNKVQVVDLWQQLGSCSTFFCEEATSKENKLFIWLSETRLGLHSVSNDIPLNWS